MMSDECVFELTMIVTRPPYCVKYKRSSYILMKNTDNNNSERTLKRDNNSNIVQGFYGRSGREEASSKIWCMYSRVSLLKIACNLQCDERTLRWIISWGREWEYANGGQQQTQQSTDNIIMRLISMAETHWHWVKMSVIVDNRECFEWLFSVDKQNGERAFGPRVLWRCIRHYVIAQENAS